MGARQLKFLEYFINGYNLKSKVNLRTIKNTYVGIIYTYSPFILQSFEYF